MGYIESGKDLARFAHAPRLQRKREIILRELAQRLNTPQRLPVRIRKPFRSTSPVALGDIFAFELPDGRTVILRCTGIQGEPNDNWPTVEVLEWDRPGFPPEPAQLSARAPRPGRPGLITLFRRPSHPDPSERITMLIRSTPVRERTLPSLFGFWAELDRALASTYGR